MRGAPRRTRSCQISAGSSRSSGTWKKSKSMILSAGTWSGGSGWKRKVIAPAPSDARSAALPPDSSGPPAEPFAQAPARIRVSRSGTCLRPHRWRTLQDRCPRIAHGLGTPPDWRQLSSSTFRSCGSEGQNNSGSAFPNAGSHTAADMRNPLRLLPVAQLLHGAGDRARSDEELHDFHGIERCWQMPLIISSSAAASRVAYSPTGYQRIRWPRSCWSRPATAIPALSSQRPGGCFPSWCRANMHGNTCLRRSNISMDGICICRAGKCSEEAHQSTAWSTTGGSTATMTAGRRPAIGVGRSPKCYPISAGWRTMARNPTAGMARAAPSR